MKELARKPLSATDEKKRGQRQDVEQQLGLCRRPAGRSLAVFDREPIRFAQNSETTSVQHAANASQDDAYGSHNREQIAGSRGVVECAFGKFDTRITS